MKKLKFLIANTHFWLYFLGIASIVLAIETFFLGMWTMPIINYQIPYMGEITIFDTFFIVIFALIFGGASALFFLAKRLSVIGCSVSSSSGIISFFTLLCPVCPVFFLTYFGLSTTIMILSPYFWIMRIIALSLLIIGLILLWKNYVQPKNKLFFDWYAFIQKISIISIIILLLNNQALAIQLGEKMSGHKTIGQIEITGDFAEDIANLVTPKTLPFYGPELGLDFSTLNNINTSIRLMSKLAPLQGSDPIVLSDEEMKRYVKIGTESLITCEFCCGVKTLVREDGSPTCGCAHSIAMRGTAAYLIQNYPEKTNEDIAYELMRQKGLYFPKQMQKRMASQLADKENSFTPDTKYLTKNLKKAELSMLQEKARKSGFKPSNAPGMVGGC